MFEAVPYRRYQWSNGAKEWTRRCVVVWTTNSPNVEIHGAASNVTIHRSNLDDLIAALTELRDSVLTTTEDA